MKLDKSYVPKILKKSFSFLIAGAIVTGVTLIMPNSYSIFTKKYETLGNVSAISKNELIEDFKVVNDGIPTIKIKKTKDLGYDPIVYFSVEGEAASYILHIQPVKLVDDSQYYNVPINVNVNLYQVIDLLKNYKQDCVPGKIRLKYLNEFIDEEAELKLSKSYLISKYLEEAGLLNSSSINLDNPDIIIKNILIQSASQVPWEQVNTENDKNINKGITSSNESYNNPINPLSLTEEQRRMIDAVTPGMFSHINILNNTINNYASLLNDKTKEIKELNDSIAEKNNQIELYESEIKKLQETNIALTNTIDSLYKENSGLAAEKQGLEISLDSLSKENNELKEKINELNSIVDELTKQVNTSNPQTDQPPSN